MTAQRKKVVALLTDAQKRQFQKLAGDSYDFGHVPQRFARAPEVRGVDDWINSAPLSLAELRGKVVALHFFTFGCINCIHNQPAYKDWHERFSAQDVVLFGIHTPEGESDRKLENIRKAIQEQGIKYPVAVDNQKDNWTAWANHTWPAVYLIDKEGYVRYWWYGELNWQGAQGEKLFRERIAELLAETNEPSRGVSTRPVAHLAERLTKTDAQWKKQLTAEQYSVTRRKGTRGAVHGRVLELQRRRGFIAASAVGRSYSARKRSSNRAPVGPVFGPPSPRRPSLKRTTAVIPCIGPRCSVRGATRIWGTFFRMGRNPPVCDIASTRRR